MKSPSKLKNHSASRQVEGSYLFLQLLIDSWAVDLVKIVGKFGSILRRHPDAIYKLFPPFLPSRMADPPSIWHGGGQNASGIGPVYRYLG